MGFLHVLKSWVQRIVGRFKKTAQPAPAEAPPIETISDEHKRWQKEFEAYEAGKSTGWAPPPETELLYEYANRHERRRLEKLRRKHDKFVIPQGPQPVRMPRGPRAARPKPAPPPPATVTILDDSDIIADKHHDDPEGEKVLYEETEIHGEFNFRDTILQQLERYFVYIERMKKRDPESYGFYKQIGATLLPYMATGSYNREEHVKDDKKEYAKNKVPPLPEWFLQTRPSFGCFCYGTDPETEKFESKDKGKEKWWVPKFMYFLKYKLPPPEIQHMSGGDTYKMTIWWDRPFDPKLKRKHGFPQEFAIFVSSDGKQMLALRQIDTKWIPVHSKRKHTTFHVPQRAWHIPSEYESWAKEKGVDAQKMLCRIFSNSVMAHTMAQGSIVRIAASKGDTTAVFGVNIRRMAYFFQDRDIHLTEHGTRKRVFHMVKAHIRKSGATVPFHFRGEKEFTWAGYKVSITVPGRDHFMLDEFNVGVEDSYWKEPGQKYLTEPEMGTRLAGYIKRGVGGYKQN